MNSKLASASADVPPSQSDLSQVVDRLSELKAVANELFEVVSIELESDPEVEACDFLVFNVRASGEVQAISRRRQQWHRRTADILGDHCGLARLMIDVQ